MNSSQATVPNDTSEANVRNALSTIKNLISKLKDQVSVSFESGNDRKTESFISTTSHDSSLLNSMNLSFLNYLKKILVLVALKVNGFDLGLSIGGREEGEKDGSTAAEEEVGNMAQNLIWSMVKDRFLIEKSSQLKLKLKYQIDKLIKASLDEENDANNGDSLPMSLDDLDPLAFKPNPAALLNAGGGDDRNEGLAANGQENLNSGDGIYRPPRLAPVHYDDGAKSTKSSKLTEKIKDKASKSRLLRDLQQQYDDAPEDMDAMGLGYSGKETLSKLDKELDEREQFEEANFIRLATSKKLKKQIKNQITHRFRDEFDDLKRDFRDLRGVHDAVEQDFQVNKKTHASKGSRKDALVRDGEGDDEDSHGGKRKRMYDDVDQLISGMAKTRGSKDGFKAARKVVKRTKMATFLKEK